MKLKNIKFLAASEAYALYLLTGLACVTIGGSMTQLAKHFNVGVAQIAVFGSCYAFGRVATVFISGYLTEKFGPKPVVFVGSIFLLAFLLGVPNTTNYILGLVFSALGGMGMGTQDATCPVILHAVFPKRYPSAMSAGQAFFGIGSFTLPLIMSVVLFLNLPFQVTFFILAIVPILMIVVLPFINFKRIGCTGKNESKNDDEQEIEQEHQPELKLKNRKLGNICFYISCFSYSAVVSSIALYTSTYVTSFGVPESLAVSMLSVYNIGSMIGSMIFVIILRKVHTTSVAWINSAFSLACIIAILSVKSVPVLFICFALAGFFLGVIFSLILSISTGLNPKHPSIAAAAVAVIGGSADVLSPFITGTAVTNFGIRSAFYYIVIMLVVTIGCTMIFRKLYTARLKSDAQMIESN